MTKKEVEAFMVERESSFYAMKKAELDARTTYGAGWRDDRVYLAAASRWAGLSDMMKLLHIAPDTSYGLYKTSEDFRAISDLAADVIGALVALKKSLD